jgi:hypothetical protein
MNCIQGNANRNCDIQVTDVRLKLIPVAERCKARVYGISLTGIAGLNPAGGMDV